MEARTVTGSLRRLGDAGTALDELTRALEPDAAQKVERRHPAVLHEQPQQMTFSDVPDRRHRRHAPLTLGSSTDGFLYSMHGRRTVPAVPKIRRQLRVARRA